MNHKIQDLAGASPHTNAAISPFPHRATGECNEDAMNALLFIPRVAIDIRSIHH